MEKCELEQLKCLLLKFDTLLQERKLTMEKYELEQLRRLLEKFFTICANEDETSGIHYVLFLVNQTLKLFN